VELDARIREAVDVAVVVDDEHVLVDLDHPADEIGLLGLAQEHSGELADRSDVLPAIADERTAVGPLRRRADGVLERVEALQQSPPRVLVRCERHDQPRAVIEPSTRQAPRRAGLESNRHRRAIVHVAAAK
jgi:hypothetical protein